jgi:outer membrane usher protein FimD/PapC
VSFDRGRVERQRDGIFPGLGQRFKDCTPSPALGPAVEAIVDGRIRAVLTRTVAPSRTGLQHVNDPADDAAVVVSRRSPQPRWQMTLNTRPLSIIQPKQPRAHSPAPESKRWRQGNHAALIRYRP